MDNIDLRMNDFAIRSFRDTADGDYIAARLAFRAKLAQNFLWSSLQAIEKYLKCILVLNRIKAPRGHNLDDLLKALEKNEKFNIDLTEVTKKFLTYLDTYGRHRYFETSYYMETHMLISLDRAIWEIRRYARVLDYQIKNLKGQKIEMLRHELIVNENSKKSARHKFRIFGGRLENIIDKSDHPSRKPLLWQNAFFGQKARKIIALPGRSESGNSPLYLNPVILDEILKYVFLPKDVKDHYQEMINSGILRN